MDPAPVIELGDRTFLATARSATLATIDGRGQPRLVPVCFVVLGGDDGTTPARLYIPLDEKPKQSADPRRLARVRDIARRPEVTVLVDRWDEDWSRLGWLRCEGLAGLLEPGEAPDERERAIAALRAKYPQYGGHALEERPLIRVAIERAVGWGDLSDRGTRRSPSAGGSGSSSSPGDTRRR